MYGFHGRREPGPEGFLHTKGGLMYYHTDRLGSPVAISDRHGEPIARYAWDAYGRAMAGVFDPYNTVGFTGKQLDGATGLTYFGARWYDADSGRFMSRDPIRDGWNWYAYVGGDPVNYVDLWGLLASEAKGNEDASEINWDQVVSGVIDTTAGAYATYAVLSNPVTAVLAFETLAATSYGITEIVTGFTGRKIPSATDFMVERWSRGMAETKFDKKR